MPSMANITVKNAANTDVVYSAVTPSAGDRSPARWMANALSSIIGFRPVMELSTRSNGQNNGRICEINYLFPLTKVVNGDTVLAAKVPFKGAFTLPTNADAALAADAYVQLGNLMISQLFRDAVASGYAPN